MEYKVLKDELADIYGVQRRILTLRSTGGYWIEGIGTYDANDVMFYDVRNSAHIYFRTKTHLIACYKDGECIFSEDWAVQYYYSGIREIGADMPAAAPGAQQIYDIYGRRVTNPLPGSIYIVDGRKVVWQ